jgi:hypothetical protein
MKYPKICLFFSYHFAYGIIILIELLCPKSKRRPTNSRYDRFFKDDKSIENYIKMLKDVEKNDPGSAKVILYLPTVLVLLIIVVYIILLT